jgi:AraC family transcriptional regulator of adaptative response/methylated-DNA-[protein]-cysteine methyltransferase
MLVTDKAKAQDFYNALINRKSDYIGVFFVGVKTTSIFCIATCTARKPNFENVVFYTEMKDALDYECRPSKCVNLLKLPMKLLNMIGKQ